MSLSLAGTAFYNNNGTSTTTIAVTNVSTGNFRIVSNKISSAGFTVSSVSGGGVTNWARLYSYNDAVSGTVGNYEVWGGVVTATGAQTITFTYSGTPGVNCEMFSSELAWSGGTPYSWSVLAVGYLFSASVTTVTWPTITSSNDPNSNMAYWGACRCAGAITLGSTTGFTYAALDSNGNNAVCNPALAAYTAYAPTETCLTGNTVTWAVIVEAQPAAPLPKPVSGSQVVRTAASF